LTSSGLFTLGKTVIMPCYIASQALFGALDGTGSTPTVNSIAIKWTNTSGGLVTPSAFTNNPIVILEVRVYL
jgi:hypothetical protein